MVVLTEIANKLQNILNGVDSETSGFGHLSNYEFMVETEGFHIDHINDKDTGKNFIPVFISSMGGEYNPVPNLEEADFNIPITIYYPVRFKDDFYLLGEYLIKYFVGTQLTYGNHSGKCLSNISVAQYGEIQSIDTQQFVEWVGSLYQRALNVKELYMSMTFTLYLSTVKSGFIYGNNATCNLGVQVSAISTTLYPLEMAYMYYSYTKSTKTISNVKYLPLLDGEGNVYYVADNDKGVNGKIYTIENNVATEVGYIDDTDAIMYMYNGNIVFDSGAIQVNSDPKAQQVLDTTESDGLPTITAYSSSIKMYVDISNLGQKELLACILKGENQTLKAVLTLTIAEGVEYKRTCYFNSVILPVEKGELIALTLTFNKKADI